MAGPIRKVTRFQREINVTTTVPVQWSEKWSAPRTCPVFQVFLSDHSQYYMLHLCLLLTIRNEGFWRVILFALFLGGVFVYFPLYCFFNFCFCCLFEFLKGWLCRFVFFFLPCTSDFESISCQHIQQHSLRKSFHIFYSKFFVTRYWEMNDLFTE